MFDFFIFMCINVLCCDHNKHLMTGPRGNSEFCFPETFSVSRRGMNDNVFKTRGFKQYLTTE